VEPPRETGHGFLVDPIWKGKVLEEKYDRVKLEQLAGKPAIDDGEEWVYLSKFEDEQVVALDMSVAIWASGLKPNWKVTVVTFDGNGIVSG